VREDLEKLGVIFTDMDTALRLYPDIIKEEQTCQQERRLTVVPLLTLI
jgi:Fe-S cluster assembly scaffold protein SufB